MTDLALLGLLGLVVGAFLALGGETINTCTLSQLKEACSESIRARLRKYFRYNRITRRSGRVEYRLDWQFGARHSGRFVHCVEPKPEPEVVEIREEIDFSGLGFGQVYVAYWAIAGLVVCLAPVGLVVANVAGFMLSTLAAVSIALALAWTIVANALVLGVCCLPAPWTLVLVLNKRLEHQIGHHELDILAISKDLWPLVAERHRRRRQHQRETEEAIKAPSPSNAQEVPEPGHL